MASPDLKFDTNTELGVMDEFAWHLAFIATDRFGGLEGAELVEPTSFEDATDSCRRDPQFGRDVLAGVALSAQHLDRIARSLRRLAVR